MTSIKHRSIALIFLALMATAPFSADANRNHTSPPSFGDITGLTERDRQTWHHGRWYHVSHAGKLGWWWVVPGIELWYLYKAPTYPYPNPFATPIAMDKGPAPPPVPSASPSSRHYWYYCEPEDGYYPYVATCPADWERVPAIPPGAMAQ